LLLSRWRMLTRQRLNGVGRRSTGERQRRRGQGTKRLLWAARILVPSQRLAAAGCAWRTRRCRRNLTGSLQYSVADSHLAAGFRVSDVTTCSDGVRRREALRPPVEWPQREPSRDDPGSSIERCLYLSGLVPCPPWCVLRIRRRDVMPSRACVAQSTAHSEGQTAARSRCSRMVWPLLSLVEPCGIETLCKLAPSLCRYLDL